MVKFEFYFKRNTNPSYLLLLGLPDPVKDGFSSKIIIISGKGPIWFYGYLVRHFHSCKAIAIFDPRLNGSVVVESNSSDFKIGDVIKV